MKDTDETAFFFFAIIVCAIFISTGVILIVADAMKKEILIELKQD